MSKKEKGIYRQSSKCIASQEVINFTLSQVQIPSSCYLDLSCFLWSGVIIRRWVFLANKPTLVLVTESVYGYFRKRTLPGSYTACKKKGSCHFSFREGALLFTFCSGVTWTATLPAISTWAASTVWFEQCAQLCWQYVRNYWNIWCLLISFYRETWPAQIQGPKQYIEVNEIAQEKRVTVQLHFGGENTEFVGWFEGSPGLC